MNNSGDHPLTALSSGTYTVWSSGVVNMTNPFAPAASQTVLYGGVGQGAIVASSTDTQYLDEFVAIPVATAASNATLSGAYQVASLEFIGGSATSTRNTFSSMTADGKGGMGTVTIGGTSTALNSTATTQTSAGVTYTVAANGSGTLNFPAPAGVTTANQLLVGNKTLYVSSDGSLFIAGSPTGYDFEIGIKQPAGNSSSVLSGLYFTTDLENCTDCGTSNGIAGYGGSFNELGDTTGDELDHLRANFDGDFNSGYSSYDYTYNSTLTLDKNGYSTDSAKNGYSTDSANYKLGTSANGNYVLVSGLSGDYYLQLGVKALPVSGTGVFLNPFGVVNAGSSDPFTAQLSPGEVITLYGSGMANGSPATASAPFPNSLGGTQVLITPLNATTALNAPVYSVSATQISAVVPYNIPNGTYEVAIQVNNNGTLSNAVQAYIGSTSPGVFTIPTGGLGNGAILHADYTLVSNTSPAKAGETVLIFLTGLGAVSPAVTAGRHRRVCRAGPGIRRPLPVERNDSFGRRHGRSVPGNLLRRFGQQSGHDSA
ncbi:conserved hypothetical protein [Candidatus Sulfopaludibacter sp. SbA3]|nr:conserved hypothetical protein [Candidatus Sulfopaludibacter sp. SbA3]